MTDLLPARRTTSDLVAYATPSGPDKPPQIPAPRPAPDTLTPSGATASVLLIASAGIASQTMPDSAWMALLGTAALVAAGTRVAVHRARS